jgi:hypothetical protein
VCEYAASAGNLEMLKWAHNNGCAWDKDTCLDAAQHDHLAVLQWAVEHQCPVDLQQCLQFAPSKGPTHSWLLQELGKVVDS